MLRFSINLMFYVFHSRHSGELQTAEGCHSLNLSIPSARTNNQPSVLCTYNLLNGLNVIIADPNPPRSSEMPPSLERQVLDHDAREHDELGVYLVQYGVVGQV